MRRITITAALAAAAVLALAGTASADIGDIDDFDEADDSASGTATAAQISGTIRCTTNVAYGLVLHVAQNSESGATTEVADNDAEVEGVGAFGPNAGNEANSPCTTSLQDWEVVVQVNRDSDPYQNNRTMGIFAVAGTSAENGDRSPGPFIGDAAHFGDGDNYERTDP
jgi:hypothetical protein